VGEWKYISVKILNTKINQRQNPSHFIGDGLSVSPSWRRTPLGLMTRHYNVLSDH